MNWKQIGLGVVLADFAALTAYAVYQYGYVGFFEACLSNWATATVFVDLCIALTMVLVWMWGDARRHGVSPIPYTVLTLALGSVGPLAYLIHRAGVTEEAENSAVLGTVAEG
jgi:hypothetical protein